MHTHTQRFAHAHTQTPVAYQGNETEEKVFKKRKVSRKIYKGSRTLFLSFFFFLSPFSVRVTLFSGSKYNASTNDYFHFVPYTLTLYMITI